MEGSLVSCVRRGRSDRTPLRRGFDRCCSCRTEGSCALRRRAARSRAFPRQKPGLAVACVVPFLRLGVPGECPLASRTRTVRGARGKPSCLVLRDDDEQCRRRAQHRYSMTGAYTVEVPADYLFCDPTARVGNLCFLDGFPLNKKKK